MAKEVKDLTSKEVDEVKILKTSLSECPRLKFKAWSK